MSNTTGKSVLKSAPIIRGAAGERKAPEIKKPVQDMLRKIGKPITTPVTIGKGKK